MRASLTPRFVISVRTCCQSFAPPTGPDPQAQGVPFAVDGDADSAGDRAVRDRAVADLDDHRIDEGHRIDTVQGPVLPFGHLASTLSAILEMVSLDTSAP